MSSSRKGRYLPQLIRDLDFTKLHGSQMWVLSDFVGARRAMTAKGTSALKLRSTCMRFSPTLSSMACDAAEQAVTFAEMLIAKARIVARRTGKPLTVSI